MSSQSIEIKKVSSPERCETCHQSDMFDATTVFCRRCDKDKLQTSVTHFMGTQKHLISDHVKRKNDELIGKYKKRFPAKISWFMDGLKESRRTVMQSHRERLLNGFRKYWGFAILDYLNIPSDELSSMSIESKVDLISRLPRYRLDILSIKFLWSICTLVLTIMFYVFSFLDAVSYFFKKEYAHSFNDIASVTLPISYYVDIFYNFDSVRKISIPVLYWRLKKLGYSDAEIFDS